MLTQDYELRITNYGKTPGSSGAISMIHDSCCIIQAPQLEGVFV